MKRRNFIKGVIGGCLGAAGVALGARAENGDSPLRRPGGGAVRDDSLRDDARLVDLFAHPWWNTIFCQLSHAGLLGAVSSLAGRLRCSVQLGRPETPDVIALPAFVVIVDRASVGRPLWDTYLEYRREVGDKTPCIIAENGSLAAGWPIEADMRIIDPGRPLQIQKTLQIVGSAQRVARTSAARLRDGGGD